MEQLIQYLPKDGRDPRLWFEELSIFSEPDPKAVVRTVRFKRGMNVVWAKEPVVGDAVGVRAAGHGVGKSSLCLLLRFCLGDPSKAVSKLRDELHGELPRGGVLALVHMEGQVFTLCRYFNPHREGFALDGIATENAWSRTTENSDRDFLDRLARAMMAQVSPEAIPDTGQEIEWRHILAWISRDQGSRFKSFFAWRESEGSGLHRSRQDPPVVMRAALGLMGQPESSLMSRIATLEQELERARQKAADLQREPALIRRRIESNLRAVGSIPEGLPVRAEDLFGDSVEIRIKAVSEEAADRLLQRYREQERLDQDLAELRVELKVRRLESKRADAEYDFADAGRRGDEDAYRSIGAGLLRLKNLSGDCKEGNVPFSRCEHVKAEINRLSLSSFLDQRDKQSLQKDMSTSAGRAATALSQKKDAAIKVEELERQEAKLVATLNKVRMSTRTTESEASKWSGLLDELDRWERSAGSDSAQAEVDAVQADIARIERDLMSTRTKLILLHQERTARESTLAAMTDALTQRLLPDSAYGSFDPRDEERPFRLSMRGGEAYRVLEVLLGDLTCMLDSANDANAMPGLLIHDCPREADMSIGLYERFLSLVGELEGNSFADAEPSFQYIVTTTTPPPKGLPDEAICLTLEPDSEEGLLFRRRFGSGQAHMN